MCIGVVLYHTSNTKIISSELIEYNIPLSLTTAGIMHCLTISLSLCKLTQAVDQYFVHLHPTETGPGEGVGQFLTRLYAHTI